MKETLEHLLCIVQDCDLSADHYRKYLNTNSKDFWDSYHIEQLFIFNLCRLYDENLLDSKYDDILLKAVGIHDKLEKIDKYHNKSEGVLTLLHQIKEIIIPLTLIHLKDYQGNLKELKYFNSFKEKYLRRLDPEFYSLLQNL